MIRNLYDYRSTNINIPINYYDEDDMIKLIRVNTNTNTSWNGDNQLMGDDREEALEPQAQEEALEPQSQEEALEPQAQEEALEPQAQVQEPPSNKYLNILEFITQEEYVNYKVFKIGDRFVKIKPMNNEEYLLLNNGNNIEEIELLGVIKNGEIKYFKT